MTATLVFNPDAETAASPYLSAVEADVLKDWNDFISRFDTTKGTFTVNLHFIDGPYAASSAPGSFATIIPLSTSKNGMELDENSDVKTLTTGGTDNFVLNVYNNYLQNAYQLPGSLTTPVWAGDPIRVFSHEFLHVFGNDYSFYDRGSKILGAYETTYDRNVQIIDGSLYFVGQNAMALYGGPVPLDASIDHPYFGLNTASNVNHATSIMNYDQETGSGWGDVTKITDFDVAMMRDDGVPILTSNEVHEHQIVALLDVYGLKPSFITVRQLNQQMGAGASLATISQRVHDALHSWLDASQAVTIAKSITPTLATNPNAYFAGAAEEEVGRLAYALYGKAGSGTAYEGALKFAETTTASVTQIAQKLMDDPAYTAHFGANVSNSTWLAEIASATQHGMTAGEWWGTLKALDQGVINRAYVAGVYSDLTNHVWYMAGVAGSSDGAPLGLIPTMAVNHTG